MQANFTAGSGHPSKSPAQSDFEGQRSKGGQQQAQSRFWAPYQIPSSIRLRKPPKQVRTAGQLTPKQAPGTLPTPQLNPTDKATEVTEAREDSSKLAEKAPKQVPGTKAIEAREDAVSKLAEEAPPFQTPSSIRLRLTKPWKQVRTLGASQLRRLQSRFLAPFQIPGSTSSNASQGSVSQSRSESSLQWIPKQLPKLRRKLLPSPRQKQKPRGSVRVPPSSSPRSTLQRSRKMESPRSAPRLGCKGSPKPQQPQELEAAAKPKDGKPTKCTKVGVTGSVRVPRSHSSPRSSRLQRSRKMESRRSAPRLG